MFETALQHCCKIGFLVLSKNINIKICKQTPNNTVHLKVSKSQSRELKDGITKGIPIMLLLSTTMFGTDTL